MDDLLEIGGKKISNRFFIGTGKFSSKSVIRDVLEAAEAEVVTVALRRVDTEAGDDNVLDQVPEGCIIMANTSGARNAREAVRIARLARASGCGDWIKIEVIPDNKYLLPDNEESIKATRILAKEGFTVLPYMTPDLISARKFVDAGAGAVMPLGSLIGSNRGFKTEEIVKVMVDEIKVPVIVDAGLGQPSQAARCMELGCGAVLINTAVAIAKDPVNMARAFNLAVKAGRAAYNSGSAHALDHAEASSPLTGFLR